MESILKSSINWHCCFMLKKKTKKKKRGKSGSSEVVPVPLLRVSVPAKLNPTVHFWYRYHRAWMGHFRVFFSPKVEPFHIPTP